MTGRPCVFMLLLFFCCSCMSHIFIVNVAPSCYYSLCRAPVSQYSWLQILQYFFRFDFEVFSHSISSILFYLLFGDGALYISIFLSCFFFVCTLSLSFYLFHPRCVLFYVVTAKLCKYDAILSSEWQTAVDFDIHFYHNTLYLWQWQNGTIANSYFRMCVCVCVCSFNGDDERVVT